MTSTSLANSGVLLTFCAWIALFITDVSSSPIIGVGKQRFPEKLTAFTAAPRVGSDVSSVEASPLKIRQPFPGGGPHPCPDRSAECIMRHLVQLGLMKPLIGPRPLRYGPGAPRSFVHENLHPPPSYAGRGSNNRGIRTRSNSKYRPECWQDTDVAPPPYGASERRRRRLHRVPKAIATARDDGQLTLPCLWEEGPDFIL